MSTRAALRLLALTRNPRTFNAHPQWAARRAGARLTVGLLVLAWALIAIGTTAGLTT